MSATQRTVRVPLVFQLASSRSFLPKFHTTGWEYPSNFQLFFTHFYQAEEFLGLPASNLQENNQTLQQCKMSLSRLISQEHDFGILYYYFVDSTGKKNLRYQLWETLIK
jgi:hypothetical protein